LGGRVRVRECSRTLSLKVTSRRPRPLAVAVRVMECRPLPMMRAWTRTVMRPRGTDHGREGEMASAFLDWSGVTKEMPAAGQGSPSTSTPETRVRRRPGRLFRTSKANPFCKGFNVPGM